MSRKGTIKVDTQDILPIIKKWLYSEHDIFLRELVSNGSDAITKRATLSRSRNVEIPDAQISVAIDKENKILTISDNGIGMTEEEVEKYLGQLAFSGAEEFVKKMKDAGAETTSDIIGKFGLGFYSAFMVSDKVEVETLSMNENAKPVRWVSDGSTEFEFFDGEKSEVGTSIKLFLNSDSEEFLDYFKVRETLSRYCDFMPYPIIINDLSKKEEERDKEPLNQTDPLWKKDPATLKDEDYIEFYKKLFPMDAEPLFWLHLKVDHPFELNGILYFPKINPNRPFQESNIKLYSKQVFVSDNVKNIIPEFLSLLKGTIDSPDIPLNVSRSSLQGDPNIRKISNYIIKKVAESLKKLFRSDREKYEKIWEDINIFIKYGVISDDKFDEMMREMVLFKNSEQKLVTLEEYSQSIPETYKDKLTNKIVTFEPGKSDNALRSQLLSEKVQAIEIDNYIDPHFTQHVEFKKQGDKEYKFTSIDQVIEEILSTEADHESAEKLSQIFKQVFKIEDPKDEKAPKPNLTVEIKGLKNVDTAAYFKVDEQMKRLAQMTKSMGNNNFDMPIAKTLIVNPQNALIQNLLKIWEKGENKPLAEKICYYVQDLASLSSEGLDAKKKDEFVSRSQKLVQELTQFAL